MLNLARGWYTPHAFMMNGILNAAGIPADVAHQIAIFPSILRCTPSSPFLGPLQYVFLPQSFMSVYLLREESRCLRPIFFRPANGAPDRSRYHSAQQHTRVTINTIVLLILIARRVTVII